MFLTGQFDIVVSTYGVAMGAPSATFRPAPAAVRASPAPIPAALLVGSVAAGLMVVLTIALAVTARPRRVIA